MEEIESQERQRVDAGAGELASFTVFAYNQEAFVRDAIRGAFAQDYRPLEVILSDDGSSDRTFEIMQEEAGTAPADIHVVLNRNPCNLGIAHHINRVIGLARGEYVVLSAADDISLPHRTSASVRALREDPDGRAVLHATVLNVAVDGAPLYLRRNPHRAIFGSPALVVARDAYLTGSSVTLRRGMYADFPPLNADVVNEDKVTAFRCAFRGGAIYIDEPLVHYRAGVGVSTLHGDILRGREDPVREARYVRTGLARRLSVLGQMQVDAGTGPLAGNVPTAVLASIEAEARGLRRALAFMDEPRAWWLPGLFAAAGLGRKSLKIALLGMAPGLYHRYKVLRHRPARQADGRAGRT
ncbi:MAG: glycosyltransferase [Xanthomonadales bacterium]|nr:glycosyltransferase [Xanthomonadales bacterium]